MATKQRGKCPFCSQLVAAEIIEENYLRRDKLKCTNAACGETLFKCRTPGCHDYAKGTPSYDHELCPDCTKAMGDTAAEIGKSALKVGTAVATVAATIIVKGLLED